MDLRQFYIKIGNKKKNGEWVIDFITGQIEIKLQELTYAYELSGYKCTQIIDKQILIERALYEAKNIKYLKDRNYKWIIKDIEMLSKKIECERIEELENQGEN